MIIKLTPSLISFKFEYLILFFLKAERISSNKNSPFSSNLIIDLVNKGAHLSMDEALYLESNYFRKAQILYLSDKLY